MNRVGIITFHNSYNCGSMLESYAMQKSIKKYCSDKVKIIDFSNHGQKAIYGDWFKNEGIKGAIKNLLLLPYHSRLLENNRKYEEFKNKNFYLTSKYENISELEDSQFDVVVSGSDQIWNVTIKDSDDAYFLPWVKNAKKVAYAPSFGAKNIIEHADDIEKYKKYLNSYNSLSIRENNGKEWIKDMIGKEVPVLIDPTLILSKKDYESIEAKDIDVKDRYIFFYCPNFDKEICKFVKKISNKYKLKVITWSTKSYGVKMVKRFGFELAKYESPSSYLTYIKNADLIMTTSFHGTIFSTIYKKNFITIKNGEMYGDDDRVLTLLNEIGLEKQLIPHDFNEDIDYLKEVDYSLYDSKLKILKEKAIKYLIENIK